MNLRLLRPAAVLAFVFLLDFGAPLQAQTARPSGSASPPPTSSAPAPLAMASRDEQGRFALLDGVVKSAIADGNAPGAVLVVGHNGSIVYRKAFGNRSAGTSPEPMTMDTVFDLASLTKVIATTTCVMRLEQMGQIKLNDPVAKYIPDFAQNGKEDVTIRMLLTHYSGLPADLDLKEPWNGADEGFARVNASKLVNAPGSTFLYSDVGFVVLGELVQKVSGMPLDQFAQTYIFTPLNMTSTRFNPPPTWMPRIAPTQRDEHTGQMLRGTVHDPTARQMGGVAGDAGLFSSADDVAKFAQALLNGGAPILSPLVVEKMTTPQQPPNLPDVRGLGWDIDSPYSSNRGELLPVGSFGHTGFTGTSLWIDPATNTYVVLLTNATMLKDGTVISLRTEIANAVAAALNLTVTQQQKVRLERITGYNETQMAARRIVVRNGHVLNGIDILEERKFEPLKVPNVATPHIGLVTNQTGIDSHGKRTIDVLAGITGMQLTAIFSPEHGIQGTVETPNIPDGKDGATGVPIYSVYGDTDAKRRPSLDVIRRLDVIVFDLAGVGARFYSYDSHARLFSRGGRKSQEADRRPRSPRPHHGLVRSGARLRCRTGKFRQLRHAARAARYDDGRIGEAVQRREAHRRRPDGNPDARLVARRLVRFDGRDVGQPVAHHPQPQRGAALSRSRPDRRHERLRGPRDGYTVRVGRVTVFHSQGSGELPEFAQHRRRALPADHLHAELRHVCAS